MSASQPWCASDLSAANPRLPGMYQADALQALTGAVNFGANGGIRPDATATGVFRIGGSSYSNNVFYNTNTGRDLLFDAGLVARVSSETRGASTATLPCILV